MISPDEARSYVLSQCRPLGVVEVAVADALGMVLAAPVHAREAVPPFVNSSMDGYALRSQDVATVPARLRVVAEVMAGDDPSAVFVGPGEAARVMTGGVIPQGADAVCMVERTRGDGAGWVVIEDAVRAGTSVRPAGDDLAAGEQVFDAGEQIGAAHLGVLVSAGAERVLAYRTPRAGVISTGDELVSGPGPLPPGKIRDGNRPSLLARLRADGFGAVDLGQAPDEMGALEAMLERAAADCDAVLTSGGVSVGDRDLVKIVLEKLGGTTARWLQVAVKPAKPFAFAVLPLGRGVPVFGLPGNPVSALVSYELFARPALRLMAGHRNLGRPVLEVTAAEDLRREPDGRLHLVRAVLSPGEGGHLEARSSGRQGSHQLSALAHANALVLLPDGTGVASGAKVKAWLLDTGPLAPAGAGVIA